MNKDVVLNDRFIEYVNNWEYYEYFLLGSYGSSKSFNTAIKLVLKSLKEKRKILIVRKVFATLKDSCYEDIKEAISFLGVDNYFTIKKSPLEVLCRNGSKFLFKGLDDKQKLKSIKDISIVWLEEGEGTLDDYKELKDRMRIQGVDPHIIITTNPVNKTHWMYTHFFKDEDEGTLILDEERLYKEKTIVIDNVYYHHSTYRDNIFLNEGWIKNLEAETNEMLKNIKVYGKFGNVGFKIFDNVSKVKRSEWDEFKKGKVLTHYRGLDFGYSISYNALTEMAVDTQKKDLWIYNQHYAKGETNNDLIRSIDYLRGTGKEIRCDSAEPKSIEDLRQAGFKAVGCGRKEVKNGIMKMQAFNHIYIVEDCVDVYRDFSMLEHPKNDKTGKIDETRYNIDPHACDSVRYALTNYHHINLKVRNTRKPNGC